MVNLKARMLHLIAITLAMAFEDGLIDAAQWKEMSKRFRDKLEGNK